MSRLHLPIIVAAAALFGLTTVGCAGGGVGTDPTNNPNNPTVNNTNCLPSSCTIGEVTCAGTSQVVQCEVDSTGCGAFHLVMNCDANATCNGGECQTGCVDNDGDQHGDSCPRGLDCDDGDADRYHGAEEICDEKDNDCDGQADEGDACTNDCTAQACEPGERECVDAQSIRECRPAPDGCGRWTSPVDCGALGCTGGSCAGCTDGDGDQRGEGCALGADCDDSDGSRYEGATERCDGVDNDCDSSIDEDFPTLGDSCSAGIGVCQNTGSVVCDAGGSFTVCNATASSPGTELCGDGSDNDCDEQVDEGFDSLGSPCSDGIGACLRSGTMDCNAPGTGLECDATAAAPSEEVCGDGIDNNCNGQVDVDCAPQSCVEDGNEPNDTSGTATSLPRGATLSGTLCGNTRGVDLNEDWFSLGSYTAGQTMTVNMTLTNPGALHMEIYTSAFKAASSSSGTPQSVSFTADVSANYRLWIVPNNNPATTGTNYTVAHQ